MQLFAIHTNYLLEKRTRRCAYVLSFHFFLYFFSPFNHSGPPNWQHLKKKKMAKLCSNSVTTELKNL